MVALKKYVMMTILESFLGHPPTEQQIKGFLTIVKTGDSEHLCLGDVAIPLKSPAMKYMEDMNTDLGCFIRETTEKNKDVAIKSLQQAKFPVSKIWIDKDVLYINFKRKKLIKYILKEANKCGSQYGKSQSISAMEVKVKSDASRDTSAPATSYRGNRLAFHVGEILRLAGASVDLEKCDKSECKSRKGKEPPAPALHERIRGGRGTSKGSAANYRQSTEYPPPALTAKPRADVAGGEFERLVAAGTSELEEVKEKKQKGVFKDVLDILDTSVPSQQSKDQKKGVLEEIIDAHKDVKAIIKSSKEPKTETTSYTIENVEEESFPAVTADKIFRKRCHFAHSVRLEANYPVIVKDFQQSFANMEIKTHPVTPTEEEENEVFLCVTREPLPTTMIPKANQYLYAPTVHMKTNKVWNGSAEELCKILMEELKRAAAQKHGDIDTPEWSEFLEEQAWRCMTLQMLAVSHSSPLKVELEGVTQNSRESAFILYNYARLCTIFQSFEESVSEGEIPPLPDIEEVDFDQLRNDEEWILVWSYIFHFPDIIEENAGAILKGSGKFRTAAIAKFLSSLSHRVSEYYSRYHVLSEPLPHLLPTIYARLHLLKAVKTLMEICFTTLGVESPTSFM